MTAPTVSIRRVYAHTATRTGRMHLCSQRDSGALVPICGADRIRGKRIAIHDTAPDGVPLCVDCAELKVSGPKLELHPATSSPVAVPDSPETATPGPKRPPRHRASAPAEPPTELHQLADLIGRFFNIRTRISRRRILLDLDDSDLNRLLTALQ